MTVERIHAAALELFSTQGYEGTSLADIADCVGIRKQSIATYYRKKEELYLAVLGEMTEQFMSFLSGLQAGLGALPVERKLRTLVEENIRYKRQQPVLTAFYHRAVHFPPLFLQEAVRAALYESEVRSSELYREVMAEGLRMGVLRERPLPDLLASFYCLLDGLAVQLMFYDEPTLDERLPAIWAVYWDGIRHDG